MNIFVGNLACTATDQDLRQLFELYGTVDTVNVMTDQETGHPCGFGFVDMPERSTARAAIAGLHGTGPRWPYLHGQRSRLVGARRRARLSPRGSSVLRRYRQEEDNVCVTRPPQN
jgi:RNA recognition motif-containing protein